MAESSPSHLFVYGTLRRGAPMHGLLERDVEWIAPARIRGRLYDLGPFPGLTEGGRNDFVQGELYRIIAHEPAKLLDSLDRYEGQAFRRVVRAVERHEGPECDAFVYFFEGSLRGHRRIASGDYLNREERAARRA